MNPINELQLEQSVYTLFQEFLAGLFDGATHDMGANLSVQFPTLYQTTDGKVTLNNFRFGQSAPPQPLKGVSVAMVFMQGLTRKYWSRVAPEGQSAETQQMAYTKARFNFWIRCDMTDANGAGNAEAQMRKVSDLLKAVFDNAAAVLPLSQNGVIRMRPGVAQPIEATQYRLCMLPVQATLRYPILSQV